jgi:PDZ domain-containing protein
MINKIYDKTKEFIKENKVFLIILLSMILIFNIELPYKINTPGGYLSLSDRITIEGNENTEEIGLSYVRQYNGNIPFILLSYIIPDWDIIDDKDTKINDETQKEVDIRGQLNAKEAMSNATYSAYTLANNYIEIKEMKIFVGYNDNKENDLKAGDQILSVDGFNIDSLKVLNSYIETLDKDATLKVKVLRDNKELIVDSKLKDYDGKYKLGVVINQVNDYITNPNIYFDLKDNELGPSGGLMAAIDIYNKITNSNLTKGDKITGTGTIDAEGNVGEIGGVKYKLIGAVNNGAKVFLCPKENYEEALKVAKDKKYDIIIKDVNTLSDAINYLKER